MLIISKSEDVTTVRHFYCMQQLLLVLVFIVTDLTDHCS